MKKIKQNKFELYSDINLLDSLQDNNKVYVRILQSLSIMGNFSGKTNVETYDTYEDENGIKTRLWCMDDNGKIFIIYGTTNDKTELLKIEVLSNEKEQKYNISLAKKFDINSSNIELTRVDKIINFKFGRLITDENSFYNLFLGENVCYQIQIEGNETNVTAIELLSVLNKLENIPTFKHYTDIFAQIVNEKQINYDSVLLGAYKNFENIGTLVINNNQKAKILTK